jgi:hypothetical protein
MVWGPWDGWREGVYTADREDMDEYMSPRPSIAQCGIVWQATTILFSNIYSVVVGLDIVFVVDEVKE